MKPAGRPTTASLVARTASSGVMLSSRVAPSAHVRGRAVRHASAVSTSLAEENASRGGHVKVRIGVGTGTMVSSGDELGRLVEDLEARRFDSLWLSDVLTMPGDDPLTGLAFAAGRVSKLKIGTTMVLPGRNPVRLAKQIATLDRISGGRLLMTFVFGIKLPAELSALGVDADGRGALMDEVLPLLRRLWTEDGVDHAGPAYRYDALTVEPKPLQQPFDVWLGGNVPSSLRRTGRLADGWLPSMCT